MADPIEPLDAGLMRTLARRLMPFHFRERYSGRPYRFDAKTLCEYPEEYVPSLLVKREPTFAPAVIATTVSRRAQRRNRGRHRHPKAV